MRLRLLLLLATLLIISCGGDTTAEAPRDGQKVATTPTQKTDLAIECQLNDAQRKVTCTATGYTDGARLYWWTNSEPAETAGTNFEFPVTNPVPALTVSFEECNNGACQTVTTTLDTTKASSSNPESSPKQSKPHATPHLQHI